MIAYMQQYLYEMLTVTAQTFYIGTKYIEKNASL